MDKMNKYSEKISQMKKYIYDTVNKDGSFEKIIDDKNNLETKIKQRFDNILYYQQDDKDVGHSSLSTLTKNTNSNSNKLSAYAQKMRPLCKFYNQSQSSGEKNNKTQIYKKLEDIKLDLQILQEFFSYETYNTVRDNFKNKKPKKMDEIVTSEDYLDKEIDVAKPLPGTTEIQL